jgi:hypothetical protein
MKWEYSAVWKISSGYFLAHWRSWCWRSLYLAGLVLALCVGNFCQSVIYFLLLFYCCFMLPWMNVPPRFIWHVFSLSGPAYLIYLLSLCSGVSWRISTATPSVRVYSRRWHSGRTHWPHVNNPVNRTSRRQKFNPGVGNVPVLGAGLYSQIIELVRLDRNRKNQYGCIRVE